MLVPDPLELRNNALVVGLPLRVYDAEEDQIDRAGVPDELPGTRRDMDDLARTDGGLVAIDLHLPAAAENVIEFGGAFQHVGQGIAWAMLQESPDASGTLSGWRSSMRSDRSMTRS